MSSGYLVSGYKASQSSVYKFDFSTENLKVMELAGEKE